MNTDLLFYTAYEAFYRMAASSKAFQSFCRDAFGEDFSQDGFSDLWQIDQILPLIPKGKNIHILDVGCGNGKMLGYLQKQTGAFIHGLDYSQNAIETARSLFPVQSDFQVGVIGEKDYPNDAFDVITAMDTLYFAPDMTHLLCQIKRWLKPGGVFFAGYQEGDVIPRTPTWNDSVIAKALRHNDLPCQVFNITPQTYDLLKRKRQAALTHQAAFATEGLDSWYEMLLSQTECATVPFEEYQQKQVRYLITVKKPLA
ncbi:MAG: class I SAM-dependent methyltransferase [Clostridiales bacterium]|nr:class I SAM-dependent methyltransferase [Clostridiales bacterium]